MVDPFTRRRSATMIETALAKLAAIARSGPPAEREAAELLLTALLHRVTFGS